MPSTYSEKLRDPRWQKKRLKIMERDGFKCRDCGAEKSTLQVHHCHYAKGGPWETPDELLLTLCEDCHKRRAKMEERFKEQQAKLFAASSIATMIYYTNAVAKGDGLYIVLRSKFDKMEAACAGLRGIR